VMAIKGTWSKRSRVLYPWAELKSEWGEEDASFARS
jgi:hypothetical protein